MSLSTEVSISVVNEDGVSGAFFSEGSSMPMLAITLGVTDLAINLTFSVTVSDGTAIQGLDYTLQNFNVTFSPEMLTQYVTFDINDDDITEDVESFSLYFSPPYPDIRIIEGNITYLFISIDEGEYIFHILKTKVGYMQLVCSHDTKKILA